MAKNGNWSKKLFVKLIYLISRVFFAWTFFIFLAHCVENSYFYYLPVEVDIKVQYKHTRFCKFWSNFWHIVLNVPIYLDWIQLRPNWMAFSTECFQSFLCEMCLFSLVMGSGFLPLGFSGFSNQNSHRVLGFWYHFSGSGRVSPRVLDTHYYFSYRWRRVKLLFARSTY